jgi:CheY-like chemotaxis protein
MHSCCAKVHALSRIAIALSLACAALHGRETEDLNGPWKIVFDPDNRGRREGWQARESFDGPGAETITVPNVWETLRKDYEGVAWCTLRRKGHSPIPTEVNWTHFNWRHSNLLPGTAGPRVMRFAMREAILIVHKHPAIRRQMRDALRSEGCQTREAGSALDALMIAANSQRPIDVLLTDVGLPGIDGFQLAERMEKAFPAMRVIYVAGMAATPESGDRRVVWLPEPIDPRALFAAVRPVSKPPLDKKGPANAVEAFRNREIAATKTA